MARILLTGATGAFGSVLLGVLTREGHDVVCLARDKGQEKAASRIRRILKERGANPELISVIKGDILEPRCGISVHHKEFYRGRIDMMLHCAASISFDEKDRDLTYATNVGGVQEVLALAEDLGVGDIRHISTTYIAGDSALFTELERYKGQRWRNVYEETKHAGETLVHGWAMSDAESRRYMIIRPSILVGSFETGWTPTFDAFYGFFHIVYSLKQAVLKTAQAGKPLPEDILVFKDGRVSIPHVFRASETSTLNLLPIDRAAVATARLVSLPADNGIVHLVHPSPPLVADVIRHSCRVLGMTGFHIATTDAQYREAAAKHSKLAAILQRKFGGALERYVPYTTHEARFGIGRAVAALGAVAVALPAVDYAVLEKLLRYAFQADFGAVREAISA